jgi:hypothetical protein
VNAASVHLPFARLLGRQSTGNDRSSIIFDLVVAMLPEKELHDGGSLHTHLERKAETGRVNLIPAPIRTRRAFTYASRPRNGMALRVYATVAWRRVRDDAGRSGPASRVATKSLLLDIAYTNYSA